MQESKSAPELQGISQWYNSNDQSLENLKGKVVLVEFWSRSCPNCTRTIPSVKKWYEKYSPKGLVILGVHVPLHGQKNVGCNQSGCARTSNKISCCS